MHNVHCKSVFFLTLQLFVFVFILLLHDCYSKGADVLGLVKFSVLLGFKDINSL